MIERTLSVVERMRGLLLDPHPGLFTWMQALCNAKRDLDALFDPPAQEKGGS